MLSSRGLAKIADFGLAKSLAEDFVSLTRSGTIVGTPSYMAPEQIIGGTIDARTDVYSLGATLYRLATGRLAHEGSNIYELVNKILNVPIRPPRKVRRDLSPELDACIQKAMSKSAAERFASAADVAAELKRIRDLLKQKDAPKKSREADLEVLEAEDPPPTRMGLVTKLLIAAISIGAAAAAAFFYFGDQLGLPW